MKSRPAGFMTDTIFRIRTWMALAGTDENGSEKTLENRSSVVTQQYHRRSWGCTLPVTLPCKEKQNHSQTHNFNRAWKSPRNLRFGLKTVGDLLHWAPTKWDDAQRPFLTTVTGHAPPFPVPYSCSYWFYLFPETDGKTGIFQGNN